MSKEVGVGVRFDIFLDSVNIEHVVAKQGCRQGWLSSFSLNFR